MGVNLDDVVVDGGKYSYSVNHADFKVGPGAMNLNLAGEDVTKNGTAGSGAGKRCEGMFVAFPR